MDKTDSGMLAGRIPARVRMVEVGPRDGLQNEKQVLPAQTRIELIDRLSASGLDYIEIGSFVRPDKIPPLADTETVAAGITRRPGVTYAALVPNARGLERALEANLQEISIFMSVTESHNRSNTNRSVASALDAYRSLAGQARAAGLRVRAYLSTVFGCPYEGQVQPEQVRPLVEALLDLGAYQISLGDTIGVTHPRAVQQLLSCLEQSVPLDKLALHFHDTRGTALANVLAGLQMGVSTFDTSIGGLGGCPYAPGAAGNLASEDLLYMLSCMGIETGVSLESLVEINHFLSGVFQRQLMSKYALTVNS
ncbi:MAG: hydroxymethylglutaryl-CoA lyase [Candidatus Sericytochromatia bacterium]